MNPFDGLDLVEPPLSLSVADLIAEGRRRRVLLGAAASMALAGALAVTPTALRSFDRSPSTLAGPTAGLTPTPPPFLSALAARQGAGPKIDTFTSPGFTPGATVPGHLDKSHQNPIDGVETQVLVTPWATTTLYTTRNGLLCIADRAPGAPDIARSRCNPLAGLPDEGFWGGATCTQSSVKDERDDRGRVAIVYGLVRGPVTRISVHTVARELDAHLAPTTQPQLGTLYWISVPLSPGPPSDLLDQLAQVEQAQRVAYRQGRMVFACQGDTCR